MPADFTRWSNWQLACEEVLDTDHGEAHYEACRAELRRRGLSAEEVEAMRRFAWETAGWLNYDCMLWDWTNLDEGDVERAIDGLFAAGRIGLRRRAEMRAFLERYRGDIPPA